MELLSEAAGLRIGEMASGVGYHEMRDKKLLRRYIIIIVCLMFLKDASAALPPKAGSDIPKRPQNIALDFLDMERPFGASSRHVDYIRGLIAKARAAVRVQSSYDTNSAIATLQSIDRLLKREGFVFGRNLLLSKGIDAGRIDCDNYCALYVAIAEEMTIPIVPVYAPNHGFIRFYLNDGSYLNWETTTADVVIDDHYVKTMRISEESIRKGVYLAALQRKEFIAVEYNNIGAYLMSLRRFEEAAASFTMALRNYPAFSSAYHNRGSCFYALKRGAEALKDLLTARDLDPMRPGTRNTLGDIYFDMKEYAKAEEEYRAAIRLDPDDYIPCHNLGILLKETGRLHEGRKWIDRAVQLRKHPHDRKRQ